jgi:hypothetical protein
LHWRLGLARRSRIARVNFRQIGIISTRRKIGHLRYITSPIPKTGVGVHTKHEFLPPEPFLCFSQRTCPIHYFRSKTHVWGAFVQFRSRTSPIPKTGIGCIQSTSFCHRNHFFVFRNEHARSTTLGPKHGLFSRNSVVARHPFRKRVSSAYKARVFATGTISSFFATNMPNPLL